MEKALRSLFVTLFPRGYYGYPPPLIAVGGISCPYSVKTTEIWGNTIQIQLIPDEQHLHLQRLSQNQCSSFCSSPTGGILVESFINLYCLVGFGSGVAGYFGHQLKNSGR